MEQKKILKMTLKMSSPIVSDQMEIQMLNDGRER